MQVMHGGNSYVIHEFKQCFVTVPFLDKRSREDPHESSQTNQLHLKLFQNTIDGAVELCSAPVQLMVHDLVGGQTETEFKPEKLDVCKATQTEQPLS